MKRETDYKGWASVLIIVLGPAWIIYHSTKIAYPGLINIVSVMLIITAGTALLAHANADEPDAEIRKAWGTILLGLALLGGANVWVHVTLTRDISAASEAKAEFHKEADWEQEQKDKDAARRQKLAASQSALNESQKGLEQAQARKLSMLPPSQRRLAPKADNSRLLVSPELTASEKEPQKTAGPATPIMTEAEVREEGRWQVILVLMLDMLLAIGGAAWIHRKKVIDANGNDIPDYIERMYETMPDYVRARFPQLVPRIEQWRAAHPPLGNV